MIRVAVVASTTAGRAGLAALLGSDPDVDVIGQAASLTDLPTSGEEPDVLVVMDDRDPSFRMAGLQSWLSLGTGLVLLVEEPPPDLFSGDTSRKALGLLLPDASREELIAAVHAVHEGLFAGDPALFGQILERPATLPRGMQLGEAEHTLTERESQVLQLLAQGLANKQIADVLKISSHTVKFHIASIYAKIGATNRAEAVRLGLQRGFITL